MRSHRPSPPPVPHFPLFPHLQTRRALLVLFLLLSALLPSPSFEPSLDFETIESDLPVAQIGRLRL